MTIVRFPSRDAVGNLDRTYPTGAEYLWDREPVSPDPCGEGFYWLDDSEVFCDRPMGHAEPVHVGPGVHGGRRAWCRP